MPDPFGVLPDRSTKMGTFTAFFEYPHYANNQKIQHLSLEDGINKAISLIVAQSFAGPTKEKDFYEVILKHLIKGFTVQKQRKGSEGKELINIIEIISNGVQQLQKTSVELIVYGGEFKQLLYKVHDAATTETAPGADDDEVVKAYYKHRKD
ncbi:MAG: hypothetical protein Q9220_001843 [cf. Caloplaca sp. 1 TL-2023]